MNITPTLLLLLTLVVYFVSAAEPYTTRLQGIFPEEIETTGDVLGDGNCGPRSLAKLVYNNEDDWELVREKMATELREKKDFYIRLFRERYKGMADTDAEAVVNLEYEDALQSIETKGKWIDMPTCGHVAANVFGRPVAFFLDTPYGTPETFLPDTVPEIKEAPIAFAHVDKCHYIPVYLKPNGPLPPINAGWKALADEDDVRVWDIEFRRRGHFVKMKRPDRIAPEKILDGMPREEILGEFFDAQAEQPTDGIPAEEFLDTQAKQPKDGIPAEEFLDTQAKQPKDGKTPEAILNTQTEKPKEVLSPQQQSSGAMRLRVLIWIVDAIRRFLPLRLVF